MSRPRVTLADLYRNKPLTDTQCRRIVALLGLAQPRHENGRAGAATPTPPAMPSQQQAS